jgi:hypothetical protein
MTNESRRPSHPTEIERRTRVDRRQAGRRSEDPAPVTSQKAEFRRIRRMILMTGVWLAVGLAVGGSIEDYRSCLRQNTPRGALAALAPNVKAEAVYWRHPTDPHTPPRPKLAAILDQRAQRLDVVPPTCVNVPPGT